MPKPKYAMRKDLNHLRISCTVHLWHVIDGKWKSLTNSSDLILLARHHKITFHRFIELLKFELLKVEKELNDGFVFYDYRSKDKGYIYSKEGWNKEVEQELKTKGYLASTHTP